MSRVLMDCMPDAFSEEERRQLQDKMSKMGMVLQKELHELNDQAVDIYVCGVM